MAASRKTMQFTCPYCPKRFAEASLRLHFQFHAAQELDLLQGFKCAFCEDTKETPRQRYVHVNQKHRGKTGEQIAQDSKNETVQAVLGRARELFKEFWQDYAVVAKSIQDGAGGSSDNPVVNPPRGPEPLLQPASKPQGPSGFRLKLSIQKRPPPAKAPTISGGRKKRRKINQLVGVSCTSSCTMGPYKPKKSLSVPEACEVCGEEVLGFSAYMRHYKHRHLIIHEDLTFVCEFCDGAGNSVAEVMRTKAQAGKHTMKHSARLKKFKTMVLEANNGSQPGTTSEAARQDILPLAPSQTLNLPGPSRNINVFRSPPAATSTQVSIKYSASTGPSTPVSSLKPAEAPSLALALKNFDSKFSNRTPAFETISKREVASPPPPLYDQNGFLLHLQPATRTRAIEGTLAVLLETAEAIVSPEAAAAAAAAAAPATSVPVAEPALPNIQVDVKPILPILVPNPPPRRSAKKALNKKRKPEPEVIFEGFRCPYKKCRIFFSSKAKLEAHRNQKRHRAICKRCPKLFDASAGSKYCNKCISAMKLEKEAHKPENWTPKPPIKCFDCPASFDSEPDFMKHLDRDHGDQTIDRKCSICHRILKSASASQFYHLHYLTHVFDEERPIRCPKCTERFKDAQDCDTHDKQDHQDPAPANINKKRKTAGAGTARHQVAFNRHRKSYKINFYS